MKDIFISYTKADKAWAEWIAWTLEEAGLSVIIQAWDFRPGGNFVLDMQRAASGTEKTIVVLSPAYLEAQYTQPEWAAALAQDPDGKQRKLIPVRVAECQPTAMLSPIIYVDLLGLQQDDARAVLLGAFSERAKPSSMPAFPGAQSSGASGAQPAYPGTVNAASTSTANILANLVESADQSRRLSASQRLQFISQLNAILSQHFNMLLFAVKPPNGLIPPMPAAQADRTIALLMWAEGPGGCGLSVLQELLDKIITPSPFGNVEQSNPKALATPISLPPVQTESPAVSGKVSPSVASLIDALYREEINEAISESLLRSENARTAAVKTAEAVWNLLYDNRQSVLETLGKDYSGLQLFDRLKDCAATLQSTMKSAANDAKHGYVYHNPIISICESARMELAKSLREFAKHFGIGLPPASTGKKT